MNLLDLEKGPFIGLFAGESGSGKSVAIASFAELGKMLYFDFDRRARGILGAREFLSDDVLKNIELKRPDVTKGFAIIDQELEMLLVKQQGSSFPYKTVVFESLSAMQMLLIQDSVNLRGNAKNKPRKVGTVDMTDPQDFLYVSRVFHQFFWEFIVRIKCNVIVSSWIVPKFGKAPDAEDYAPEVQIGEQLLLTSKFASMVPGYFDEVYSFFKETNSQGKQKYFAEFTGSLAKTTEPALVNAKKIDVTGVSFLHAYNKLTSRFNIDKEK